MAHLLTSAYTSCVRTLEPLASYFSLRPALAAGTTTCVAVVEQCLATIAAQEKLNVFVNVYADEALARAAQLDEQFKAGTAGPLAGLVVGIKDLLVYKDHPVQGGSKILNGFVSQFTCTAVQRLIDAGAIIIGHQNCDEFGMGSSNQNSCWGPALHPLVPQRVPGGSSGGSAAAVRAGMCHVALGTDTGGSVRQPAAFCGVIGIKPSYARVSRYGLIAYSSSFDTISVFSAHLQDGAAALAEMAGQDDNDNTSAHVPVPAYAEKLAFTGKAKVAYLTNTLHHEGVQKEIVDHTSAALERLKAAGHTVEGVEFPLLDYALPTYYILTTAEASANLARFDGVRYGHRSEKAHDLQHLYTQSRTEGFGPEVKRRIMLGTYILSEGYCDAYFTQAQRVRRMIQEQLGEILAAYDFIVLPTTPTTAFKCGEHTQNPVEMYLADLFTVGASVAGFPAISIPNGVDEQQLPIGLQVVANAFQEEKMLAFAQHLQGLGIQ